MHISKALDLLGPFILKSYNCNVTYFDNIYSLILNSYRPAGNSLYQHGTKDCVIVCPHL